MNIETWILLLLVFLTVLWALIHFKAKGKIVFFWIFLGLISLGSLLYRQGIFGNAHVDVIDGPSQSIFQHEQEKKSILPPKLDTEKNNVWEDTKSKFNKLLND